MARPYLHELHAGGARDVRRQNGPQHEVGADGHEVQAQLQRQPPRSLLGARFAHPVGLRLKAVF